MTGQQILDTKHYFERIKTALVEGRPAEARRVRLELYSRTLEMVAKSNSIFNAEDAKKVLRAQDLGIPEEDA